MPRNFSANAIKRESFLPQIFYTIIYNLWYSNRWLNCDRIDICVPIIFNLSLIPGIPVPTLMNDLWWKGLDICHVHHCKNYHMSKVCLIIYPVLCVRRLCITL